MQFSRRRPVSYFLLFSLGLFMLLLLLLVMVGAPRSQRVSAETPPPLATSASRIDGVTLHRNDPSAATFTIDIPVIQTDNSVIDGRAVTRFTADGYVNAGTPGAPDLPQKSYWLALPPGATASLTIDAAVDSAEWTGITVQPATYYQLNSYDAADPDAVPVFEEQRQFNDGAYTRDEWVPAAPATLGDILHVRDYRLVPLQVHPVQVNTADQTARTYSALTVTVTFNTPDGSAPDVAAAVANSRPESATFTDLFSGTVLNFDAASTWRDVYVGSALPDASPCLATAALRDNAHRLTLTESGLYAVRGSDLGAAPAVDAIRMCYNDREIDIKIIDGNSNGTLDSADHVVFYGEAIKTHDTETNAYWLTYGSGAGMRMSTRDATPNGGTVVDAYVADIMIEDDVLYYSNYPLLDESDTYDHWFDERFGYPANEAVLATLEKSFTLNDAAANGTLVRIEAEVWGFSAEEDHRFQVEVNGTQVGDITTFSGSARDGDRVLFSAEFDPSLLNDGDNTITFRALDNLSDERDGAHTLLLNWVRVLAPRQLVAESDHLQFTQTDNGTRQFEPTGFSGAPLIIDVTDPYQPIELTGASGAVFEDTLTAPVDYALATTGGLLTTANSALSVTADTPSDWRSASNQADLIIITSQPLQNALTPLVAHRTAQGLDVEVVLVRDIFDEFGYGRYSTQAIRDFLEYAFTTWSGTPPSYVLLAGDSSFDHRDIMGLNQGRNHVPVYLRSGIDSEIGEAAADNQYVAFESDASPPNDLPFMHIGRLPAEDSAELSMMIDKITAYESADAASWQARHVFVADNGLKPAGDECTPDPAADFHAEINTHIGGYMPLGQVAQRIFYAPPQCYPDPQPHYVNAPGDTLDAIVDAFASGAQHINYTGHSGPRVWGDEQFLRTSDVALLSNGDRLPISLPMTCLEGQNHRFDLGPDPEESTGLSETLLKKAGGGVVASYAPTGLQVQTGHNFLIQGYYDAVFQQGVDDIGSAVYQAKLNLQASGIARILDLHDTYVLLGDPSLQYNAWRPSGIVTLPVVVTP